MRRSSVLVSPLLAVALVAGCGGGSSDEESVKESVRTYLSAFADGDGDRACDQLTGEAQRHAVDALRQQVPEFNATSCPDAIEAVSENIGEDEKSGLRDVEFQSVTIDGDRATARPVNATTDAELTKTDAGWLITSLGF
jgi:hypothetical protein